MNFVAQVGWQQEMKNEFYRKLNYIKKLNQPGEKCLYLIYYSPSKKAVEEHLIKLTLAELGE